MFSPAEIEVVSQAVEIAEDVTAKHFKISTARWVILVTISPARSLDMEASIELALRLSAIHTALITINQAERSITSISITSRSILLSFWRGRP